MPAPVSRMLLAFVVFFLSGLSHMAVSWHLGMRDTLDLQWFPVVSAEFRGMHDGKRYPLCC